MSVKQKLVPGVAFIIPLKILRKTPSVEFNILPGIVDELSSIDRVVHEKGAISPQVAGSSIERPWYMHPNQEDNLLVYHGVRFIELYTQKHAKVERFEASPDYIKHNDKIIHKGGAILGWPTNVFHRIHSPDGSMSTNFAKHFDGFDIKTNFNIYDLDTQSGEYTLLREGHLDQNL